MPIAPPRDLIAELIALNGEPKVSYPFGSNSYPVTERVKVLPRGKAPYAFLSAEPDTERFPNNVLVEQQIVGCDRTHVQIYLKFEVITGPEIVSWKIRTGGQMEKTTVQNVPASTKPTGGTNVLLDEVAGEDLNQAVRTKITLTDSSGNALGGADSGYVLRDTHAATLADLETCIRVRAQNAVWPAVGDAFGAGVVYSRAEETINGSPNVLQVIRSIALPDPYVEYPKVTVTFPGVIRFAPTTIPEDYEGVRPPWPGNGVDANTYSYLKPRTREVIARVLHTFSVGPSTNGIGIGYQVYSPGTASKAIRINEDTIHSAITVIEELPGGGTARIESIPASTPATYDPRQILVFPLGEQRVIGNIYMKRVMWVSEATPVEHFGTVHAFEPVKKTSTVPLTGQVNPGGERLTLVSSSTADSDPLNTGCQMVTIYGLRETSDGPRYSQENVNLNGTTPVQTSATYDWLKVLQVHAASVPTGNITIRGEDSTVSGSLYWTNPGTDVPANGDTITVGRTAATRTYTAREPAQGAFGIGATASQTQGAYLDHTFRGVTKRFWVDIDDAGTGAPADPGGGLYRLDFTTGNTAAQNGTIVYTAMVAAWTAGLLAFTDNLSGTVNYRGVKLGASAYAETGDTGGGLLHVATTTGTAHAANQIRTGINSDGTTMTRAQFFQALEYTVNLQVVDGDTPGGTEGVTWGDGTTIHADVSAEFDSAADEVDFEDKVGYAIGTSWTLSETSSILSVRAFATGAEGPTIATIAAGTSDRYNDIVFDNGGLVNAGAGWDDENTVIVKNMPAYTTLVTDVVAVPNKAVLLQLIAAGSPALAVSYETSANGVSGWTAGLTTLKAIGRKRLYQVNLDEPTISYIRFTIANPGAKMRAVSINVAWSQT